MVMQPLLADTKVQLFFPLIEKKISFVTPDLEQEQAASPAPEPGGRGGGRERIGPTQNSGNQQRASAVFPLTDQRVLPQLKTTQKTKQLPGKKRFLEKELPHTRVTQNAKGVFTGRYLYIS